MSLFEPVPSRVDLQKLARKAIPALIEGVISLLSLCEIAGNLNLKLISTKDGVWQANTR